MIRHIVALRFREDAPQPLKDELYGALHGLRDRIEGIVEFRTFANVSPEDPLVRGFRDVFWFDFRDAGVRDAYLADAEHARVGARPVAEPEGGADGVFVIDLEL